MIRILLNSLIIVGALQGTLYGVFDKSSLRYIPRSDTRWVPAPVKSLELSKSSMVANEPLSGSIATLSSAAFITYSLATLAATVFAGCAWWVWRWWGKKPAVKAVVKDKPLAPERDVGQKPGERGPDAAQQQPQVATPVVGSAQVPVIVELSKKEADEAREREQRRVEDEQRLRDELIKRQQEATQSGENLAQLARENEEKMKALTERLSAMQRKLESAPKIKLDPD